MNTLTFARRIAHQEGIKPASNYFLECVIWERTGYPTFWRTDDPQKEFEMQLRETFRVVKRLKKET